MILAAKNGIGKIDADLYWSVKSCNNEQGTADQHQYTLAEAHFPSWLNADTLGDRILSELQFY